MVEIEGKVLPTNAQLTLREAQLASLNILKAIDEICCRENLRYFLAYGSLIGAVRHQGFIPWDDDVDIMMPREDYEVLTDYFTTHSAELSPLTLLRNSPERSLPFLISRITDTQFRMVGDCSKSIPELGSFVDIYPLDGFGKNLLEANRARRRVAKLSKQYISAGNFEEARSPFFPKQVAKDIRSHVLGSPKKYEKLIQNVCLTTPYDEALYLGAGSDPFMRLWPSLCFECAIIVPFEDITVRIPNGYDFILRECFGNYLELPPIDEQISHHCYELYVR